MVDDLDDPFALDDDNDTAALDAPPLLSVLAAPPPRVANAVPGAPLTLAPPAPKKGKTHVRPGATPEEIVREARELAAHRPILDAAANANASSAAGRPPGELSAAARARARWAAAQGEGLLIVDPPPFEPAKTIPPESIQALARLTPEITLATPELGEIVLVAEPTPKGRERFEMTFGDAATLRLLVDSFPGARVVGLVRGTPHKVDHVDAGSGGIQGITRPPPSAGQTLSGSPQPEEDPFALEDDE